MKKIENKVEKEIISKYLRGINHHELAEQFDVRAPTILAILKRNNIDYRQNIDNTIEYQRLNFLNKKLHRLTIVDVFNDGSGAHKCKCVCECGTERIAQLSQIKRGQVKSCHKCVYKNRKRRMRTSQLGWSNFRCVIQRYKSRARRKNLIFDLSDEQIFELCKQKCFYCNSDLLNRMTQANRNFNGEFIYNGIDRMNSFEGYIGGNVVPCCFRCNTAKNNMSLDEFKTWLKSAYEHMSLK